MVICVLYAGILIRQPVNFMILEWTRPKNFNDHNETAPVVQFLQIKKKQAEYWLGGYR